MYIEYCTVYSVQCTHTFMEIVTCTDITIKTLQGIAEKMLKQDKKLAIRIFLQWCIDFSDTLQGMKPVFDGRNMYTPKPLQNIDKARSFTIVFE